jgi:hypothetical protein
VFGDIFEEFVWKHLDDEKPDWDNFSDGKTLKEGEKKAGESIEACRKACSKDKKCVQYNYRKGECRTSSLVRYGRSTNDGVQSGWNLERIEAFRRKKRKVKCKPTWILG